MLDFRTARAGCHDGDPPVIEAAGKNSRQRVNFRESAGGCQGTSSANALAGVAIFTVNSTTLATEPPAWVSGDRRQCERKESIHAGDAWGTGPLGRWPGGGTRRSGGSRGRIPARRLARTDHDARFRRSRPQPGRQQGLGRRLPAVVRSGRHAGHPGRRRPPGLLPDREPFSPAAGLEADRRQPAGRGQPHGGTWGRCRRASLCHDRRRRDDRRRLDDPFRRAHHGRIARSART